MTVLLDKTDDGEAVVVKLTLPVLSPVLTGDDQSSWGEELAFQRFHG